MKKLSRKIYMAAPLAVAILTLGGCGSSGDYEKRSETFFAMDTVMEITVYGDPSLPGMAKERIDTLDGKLSVTDEGSEIYELNQKKELTVSRETYNLLSRALEICAETDGKLDITVYPVVRAWGFTTGEYRVPSDRELKELLQDVDYTRITMSNGEVVLEDGMQVDLGSVAKGYAGDQVVGLFREKGVTSALLNLGGNVQALGAKPDGTPWRIAVRDPDGEGYVGALEIVDQAVVTSGGYERYFVRNQNTYGHIMDPKTGYPVDNGLISVTVVGDEGLVCDAYSTALFVMGLEDAIEFWQKTGGFEAILILEDGQIMITEGIEGHFFLSEEYRDAKMTVIRHE